MSASAGREIAISIIIPALNEARVITSLLQRLAEECCAQDEIIVADGGSQDVTVRLATSWAKRVIEAPRGRAAQMNSGAVAAHGEILWFVHADSLPLPGWRAALTGAIASGRDWGRFTTRIDDPALIFRVIEQSMNWRSRLSGIATGDQALFVTRAAFEAAGAYPDIKLMEDIELSRRLKRHSRPACLDASVTTSARRWRQHGVLRTIALMWMLRLAWFVGVPADRLARWYGYR